VAESGVQAIGGTFAVGLGVADVLVGSKILGTLAIAGGTYAVADSKYTFEDGTNKISDAWNNKSGQIDHGVPEGPLQSTAQDLGCSEKCQSVAGGADKVLGAVTGNLTSAVSKQTGGMLDTANKLSDVGSQVEKIKKVSE